MLANSMDHPIEIVLIFPARNAGEYPPILPSKMLVIPVDGQIPSKHL